MNNEEWQRLRQKAKDNSAEVYADKASSIIRLTSEEISEILGEAKVNTDKFGELIEIVSSAAKTNNDKAKAIRETAGFAEIAVSLISKLLK